MEIMKTLQKAVYSGTFDPITLGHLDIINRASKLFDEVVIAVAQSTSKKPMFSLEQRIKMIEASTKSLSNIKVIGFEGLLVDFTDTLDINIIIRGVRSVSDFEYELQMGYANASLKKELETVFLIPSLEYGFISSSVVRSILPFSDKVSHLMPSQAFALLQEYRK
jgi:pantetheine-phosphate adenylyltransferase